MTAGKVIPVILSGGAGKRLWPLSRAARPKHLLELDDSESLFVRTVRRVSASDQFDAPLVICNADHRFLIAEQLRASNLDSRSIVLEPVGRNTASAVAVACLLAQAEDPDAIVMVLPSDHLVKDVGAFYDALKIGRRAADDGALVTFGVAPKGPATGFGYIRQGDALPNAEGAYAVGEFVEKPPKEVAEEFIATGCGLWNSGMFLFRAARYLEELEMWEPLILTACQKAVREAQLDGYFVHLSASFGAAPALPVDKAVMERTNAGAVVPVDFGWNDVGSWAALWDVGSKGDGDNVTSGDVVTLDTKRSYIRSEGMVVAALGLEDMVVVATEDAVLVTPMERAQDVKAIVEGLGAARTNKVESRAHVLRPWGSYKSIDAGNGFRVKWLKIKPGHRLSSQFHYRRSEHWVVVEGTASVTLGEKTFDLRTGESTFIPAKAVHRIENRSDRELTVIEVQCGDYLEEDDIVRLEDDYGRGESAAKRVYGFGNPDEVLEYSARRR